MCKCILVYKSLFSLYHCVQMSLCTRVCKGVCVMYRTNVSLSFSLALSLLHQCAYVYTSSWVPLSAKFSFYTCLYRCVEVSNVCVSVYIRVYATVYNHVAACTGVYSVCNPLLTLSVLWVCKGKLYPLRGSLFKCANWISNTLCAQLYMLLVSAAFHLCCGCHEGTRPQQLNTTASCNANITTTNQAVMPSHQHVNMYPALIQCCPTSNCTTHHSICDALYTDTHTQQPQMLCYSPVWG